MARFTMHPVLILIPAVALILGPELWVQHVLRRHNRKDEGSFKRTGGELARELLDRNQLHDIRVEGTDLEDHYDPHAKAVRLTRDKIDRKTLTAITSAAHEVGHALQHASRYPPFLLRARLAKVAQVTGKAGSATLMAAPIAALVSRNPVPPTVIATTAFIILGTGVLANVAALPSELDASFRRALPLLREEYLNREQEKRARKILSACTFTYLAGSLAGILAAWRWFPGLPWTGTPSPRPSPSQGPSPAARPAPRPKPTRVSAG